MNSVLSTLRIFEEVAVRQPIGVSELARATEMPKSSVHRCLTTLQTAGWLRIVDPDRVLWGVTTKAFALGLQSAGEHDFRKVATPVARRLSTELNETVHLGLRDGDEWIVVAREDSDHVLRVFIDVGRRLPMRATSAGVAIMARLDDTEVDALLANEPPPHFAEFPTLGADDLRVEITRTRERGYAANISSSWYRPDSISIGAAITSSTDRPIGAIVLSVPGMRFDPDDEESLARKVVVAAREISALVGTG